MEVTKPESSTATSTAVTTNGVDIGRRLKRISYQLNQVLDKSSARADNLNDTFKKAADTFENSATQAINQQEKLQQMERYFTLVSNALKKIHDTVMNVINNMR